MRVKLVVRRGKITYYYSAHNNYFRISAGVSITDNDIKKNGEIKESVLDKHPVIISKLQYLNKIVDDYIIEKKTEPTPEFVKEQLRKSENELLKEQWGFIDFYIDFYNEKKKVFESSKNRSIWSIKDYKSTWNSLIDFQSHFNTTLTLNDINEEFFSEYSTFMQTLHISNEKIKYKTKGNLNDNSLRKRYDCLFAFFRWCIEKNLINRIPKKPKLEKTKVLKTSLTTDEVLKLYKMEFTPKLNNDIKNVFVFCCHTGFRYGDLTTLRPEHFYKKKGFSFVKKRTEKTSVYVNIPLSDVAYEIAEKMKFKLNVCANATFNRIIKDVCEESKLFNDDVETNNGFEKKYKAITAHVGRHTFITNLIKYNVPLNYIMGMTGHTQLKTLSLYIQDREPENNEIVNNVFVNQYKK